MLSLSLRTLLLAAAILFSVTGNSLAAGDVEAGKVKSYTCTGCHGIPGYKNVYPTYHVPKIGGQNYEYLALALKAYRNGERDHSAMKKQTATIKYSVLALLLASVPFSLAARGDADSGREKAKVCEACHGLDGK